MKVNLAKYVVAAILLFSGVQSFAACENLKCEGVTNTFVQSLKTSDKDIYLTFPAGISTTLSCELLQGRYAKLNTKSKNFNSTHSLLLTAIASNAPLVVEFSSEQTNCEVYSVEMLVSE